VELNFHSPTPLHGLILDGRDNLAFRIVIYIVEFGVCGSVHLGNSGVPKVEWRTETGDVWVFNPDTPPPPKFQTFAKAEPNFQFRGIYIGKNLIRIWVSFICKLSGNPE
jgi:hypothetical protein